MMAKSIQAYDACKKDIERVVGLEYQPSWFHLPKDTFHGDALPLLRAAVQRREGPTFDGGLVPVCLSCNRIHRIYRPLLCIPIWTIFVD